MAISKEKFLKLFLEEFRENLMSAENQIVVLKNDQENVDALSTLLRTLHTIKGSSRMLQFVNMEKLIHGTETVFKGVREGRYAVDSRLVRFFFIVADHLRYAADSVERQESDEVPDQQLILAACEKLGANEPFDLASIASLSQGADAQPAGIAEGTDAGAPKTEVSAQGDTRLSHLDSSIRVDSQTIDRSITLVNTLTIRQLRLRSASDQLDVIEKKLTQSYRSAQDLKLLRKELSTLARAIRQYRSQYTEQLFEIEYGTQELRDTVIGMRMLPLSAILERFPRMVEETAVAIGKDVSITIVGDSVRLDRNVLAKLSDPLIHLVRNAIDHGIETAEDRLKAGKNPRGMITIECKTEGSRISLMISDDGGGLDYEAIRKKALKLWPENETEIVQLTNDELVRFLFRPGFSTKATSSTLSGRGVGLDIVKTNIESAKGQIQLESISGSGCRFTLLLPVSASTMDGMFVLCSGKKYFIPASSLARTLLVDPADCFRVRQKDMFNLDGVNIPYGELSLGLQVEQAERKTGKLSMLLVSGTVDTIGIVVDRILGYDSLVYQALPPGLRRNGLIQGIVFDSSFNIIPILNMWAVLDKLRSVRIMDTHRRFAASNQQEQPLILVVDDSISTREIEMSMLELEGYRVVGAFDGVDALEKIHAAHFDLIVSDLNMPRMDGFKLLENIRSDEGLKDLPVVFVSTVNDPEAHRKAEALGANKFILKSSFEQDDLLSTVRELIVKAGGKAGVEQ